MGKMKILRNILAVIAGLIVGGMVNMGIVMISGSIIPPPEGVDLSNIEGMREAMPLMEFRHFIMPFFAHALGTLIGAFIASFLAISHQLNMARIVGVFFLIGGIVMVVQLPSPLWFNIVDLVFAYIPMACIGGRLVKMNS
jgi:formate hydrogenlyase subunit 3/multisubunit Na+/H+ antiporter MnhD subunit